MDNTKTLNVEYRVVDSNYAHDIAKLAVCLTREIIERTHIQHFDVDTNKANRLCEDYLSKGLYTVVAAFDDNKVIGFAALCESHAIYAEGAFGIVQECYVLPEYRSQQVGKYLIDHCVAVANDKGWQRLELCTPPVPEFDQTVAFYQQNGFEITGGYKMKRAI